MSQDGMDTVVKENDLWANPCDYDLSKPKPVVEYLPHHAKTVANQARNAVRSIEEYKDEFAQVLSYRYFVQLVSDWKSTSNDWLVSLGVLPKEKMVFEDLPDGNLQDVLVNIDEKLPHMYKALKMVVAGLDSMSRDGLSQNIDSERSLATKINLSVNDVRGVLCQFYDLMESRHLEILPLPDSEIPDFKNPQKYELAFVVYRDTISYLEHLAQVFQRMSDVDEQRKNTSG